jgi:hypothetical protein
MRGVWGISMWKGGRQDDWLEQGLLSLQGEMCNRVLMIAWQIWYACNEVTHEKALRAIEGSRRFICSYMHSLENIRNVTPDHIIKDKQVIG